MSIGAMAAPVFHAVTGQKECGNEASLTLNLMLISREAAVMDVALIPTIAVLCHVSSGYQTVSV